MGGKALKNAENADITNVESVSKKADEQTVSRKKALIKFGALTVFTGVIVIIATVAWFTMNKDVDADGMSIQATELPFEIAVKGTAVRNDTEFSLADSTYTYGDDEVLAGYYVTGDDGTQIKVRFSPSDDESLDFGPGSSGKIEFYIVPKRDGDLTVSIDLDVIGFKAFGENDAQIKRISELTDDDGFTQTAINEYQTAESYLKGHIMFFEEPGDMAETTIDDSKYYYKKPITDKTFEKTILNAKKDQPHKVDLYWMWPNTVGQIVLKDNSSKLRTDFPIVQDVNDNGSDISNTDKGKVIAYLKDNMDIVFTDSSSILSSDIDNAKNETIYKKLSDRYNDADSLIGFGVSYFMVELSVSEG